MKQYYVYIMTNHTGTVLYTGVTNDLARRLHEHKTGTSDISFAKRYKLYKLIWFEAFDSITDAIENEKRIKGWKRERKIGLIKKSNPKMLDLYSNQN